MVERFHRSWFSEPSQLLQLGGEFYQEPGENSCMLCTSVILPHTVEPLWYWAA